jgi:CheY-like chemotaxis protein
LGPTTMSFAAPIRPTVLVVEDYAVTRELLAHVLHTGGFTVSAVSSGAQALLTLCEQRKRIDWLVTGLHLPGLVCGWLLADEYHRHHPMRPVLIVSEAIAETGWPAVDAIIVPPFAPMRVLESLKALRMSEPGFGRPASPARIRRAA